MSANWSGSPVGTYTFYNRAVFNVGNNQAVILAPGAGLSIYLLYICCSTGGAVSNPVFKDGNGTFFLSVNVLNGTVFCPFDGGLRMPTNKGVDVNVATNAVDISFAYAVGPTI